MSDAVPADELDHLYALPLKEFTQARNDLAAKLRAAGDKAAATEIKSLRKPSIAAWAVNQLARGNSDDMKELLDLRARMEETRDADELREAAEKRRDVAGHLVERAEAILRQNGHAASAATLQRISQTLYGGATAEERELLLTGRLSDELDPTASFAPLGIEVQPSQGKVSKTQERARRKADELAAEAEELAQEAERLERAADRAEREARRARDEAALARRRAMKARDRADRAAAELD